MSNKCHQSTNTARIIYFEVFRSESHPGLQLQVLWDFVSPDKLKRNKRNVRNLSLWVTPAAPMQECPDFGELPANTSALITAAAFVQLSAFQAMEKLASRIFTTLEVNWLILVCFWFGGCESFCTEGRHQQQMLVLPGDVWEWVTGVLLSLQVG